MKRTVNILLPNIMSLIEFPVLFSAFTASATAIWVALNRVLIFRPSLFGAPARDNHLLRYSFMRLLSVCRNMGRMQQAVPRYLQLIQNPELEHSSVHYRHERQERNNTDAVVSGWVARGK